MKRYYMEYESDEIVCRSNRHFFGSASTLKTAKGYISRCRREYAKDNPRNFRIYDVLADVAEDEHVPCVYSEE